MHVIPDHIHIPLFASSALRPHWYHYVCNASCVSSILGCSSWFSSKILRFVQTKLFTVSKFCLFIVMPKFLLIFPVFISFSFISRLTSMHTFFHFYCINNLSISHYLRRCVETKSSNSNGKWIFIQFVVFRKVQIFLTHTLRSAAISWIVIRGFPIIITFKLTLSISLAANYALFPFVSCVTFKGFIDNILYPNKILIKFKFILRQTWVLMKASWSFSKVNLRISLDAKLTTLSVKMAVKTCDISGRVLI